MAVALDARRLSDRDAEAIAALFKAIADPARVRLVNLLANAGEPRCVCELVEDLGLAQASVSHHLKILVGAGLLRREERGKWSFFALEPDACRRLGTIVDFETCC